MRRDANERASPSPRHQKYHPEKPTGDRTPADASIEPVDGILRIREQVYKGQFPFSYDKVVGNHYRNHGCVTFVVRQDWTKSVKSNCNSRAKNVENEPMTLRKLLAPLRVCQGWKTCNLRISRVRCRTRGTESLRMPIEASNIHPGGE